MFILRRPSSQQILGFLRRSESLPLSYAPIGLVDRVTSGFVVDNHSVVVGQGRAAFDRAREALLAWRHFELGWLDLWPQRAPIIEGTVVASCIRHLGFWSMNACRVIYVRDIETEFAFAYGTLTNHAECGEELFKVSLDPGSGAVTYLIRAVSRPRARLARLGYPYTRLLQARFRRDSSAAMMRAQNSGVPL